MKDGEGSPAKAPTTAIGPIRPIRPISKSLPHAALDLHACGNDGIEELPHSPIELIGRHTALGHELGRTKPDAFLVLIGWHSGGIDDDRHMSQPILTSEPFHDAEAVDLGSLIVLQLGQRVPSIRPGRGEIEQDDVRPKRFRSAEQVGSAIGR